MKDTLLSTRSSSPGDGPRGELRQGERVVGGPGRRGGRDPALGREVACDERSVIEQTTRAPAPTIYLGLDGTGVPVRPAEVEDRRGKQPDGSTKTREVKLAAVWTAERRDSARPARPRPRAGQLQRRRRECGQPRHRPAASRLRATCPSRDNTGRLRHRGPSGRHRRRGRLDLICCVRRYVVWDRKTPVKSGPDLDLRNITDRPHSFRRKAMRSASRFHGGASCGSACSQSAIAFAFVSRSISA